MRVFVLGGTGSIGSPIVRALIKSGHDVRALARSDAAAAKLAESGATPIAGDIVSPERWAAQLPRIDAVIHAACDFDTAMGATDARLLDVLLPAFAAQPARPATMSPRSRRRFVRCQRSRGWCRICSAFLQHPKSTA